MLYYYIENRYILYQRLDGKIICQKTHTFCPIILYMTNCSLRDKFWDTGVDFEKCTF